MVRLSAFLLSASVLQVALVAANPDFGVSGSVQGSAGVALAATHIEEQFTTLPGSLDFSVSSSYAALETVRSTMMSVAQTVEDLGVEFTVALTRATTSTSDLFNTFNPVLSPLNQLQTLQGLYQEGILNAIQQAVGTPIVLQLQDTFGLIHPAVQNLVGTLIHLVSNVQTSEGAENVSAAVVKNVERAILTLRAHIVLLNYTMRSTGEGIRLADGFLTRLSGIFLSGESDLGETLARLRNRLQGFQDDVTAQGECVAGEVSGLGESVTSLLEVLGSFPEGCVLQSASHSMVDLVTTELDRVLCVVRRHYTVLATRSGFVTELTDRFHQINELGLRLAFVAAANGPYALYCYHKFYRLVEDLTVRLTDGVHVCLRREATRLRSLRGALAAMLPTITYDVQDLLEHLELCGTLLAQQEQCLLEVGDLYEHLATQTEEKLDLMEKFSLAETDASFDRMKLCVLQTTYTVFSKELVRIELDLEHCNAVGPFPTDPEPEGGIPVKRLTQE